MKVSIKLVKLLYFIVASMGAAALNFLIQILLAREFSLSQFGEFNTYITFLNMISPLIGMGLSNYWIREYSKSNEQGNSSLRGSLIFLGLSFLCVFIIQFFYAFYRVDNFIVFYFLSILVLAQCFTELVNSFNLIDNNINKYVIWRVLTPLLRILLIFFLMFINEVSLINVSIVYFLSSLPVCYKFIYEILKRKSFLKGDVLPTLTVVGETWYFGFSAFLYLIYCQSNILIISLFFPYDSVALYSAGLTLISVALIIPPMIFQKFYAFQINNWFFHDRAKFKKFYVKAFINMTIFGFIITLFFYIFAELIVVNIYGVLYGKSIEILKVLSLCIFLTFVSSSCSFVFINKKQLILKTVLMLVASLFNLFFSYLVIKQYNDLLGVAWVTVFCYAFIALSFLLYSFKIIFNKEFR